MYELQRMTDYRVMKKQMMNFTIFKTFEIATMTIEYNFNSNLKFVLKSAISRNKSHAVCKTYRELFKTK